MDLVIVQNIKEGLSLDWGHFSSALHLSTTCSDSKMHTLICERPSLLLQSRAVCKATMESRLAGPMSKFHKQHCTGSGSGLGHHRIQIQERIELALCKS